MGSDVTAVLSWFLCIIEEISGLTAQPTFKDGHLQHAQSPTFISCDLCEYKDSLLN